MHAELIRMITGSGSILQSSIPSKQAELKSSEKIRLTKKQEMSYKVGLVVKLQGFSQVVRSYLSNSK